MKAGGARKLDIVLRSAAGLEKVHTTSRMAAYAVAWIEPSVRVPSPIDKRHGRNPVWDTTISITLDELTLGRAGKNLHIELLARGLVSTTPVGFVRVDMTELLLKGAQGAAVSAKFYDYPVTRRSGRQQGIINFELSLQATVSPSPQKSTSEHDPQVVAPASSNFIPSAPPLPQLTYERDSSTRSTSSSRKPVSQRHREIVSEDIRYGDVAPKRSNSRGTYSASTQEEHSLLDTYSYY
ncbi:hypothetical protein M758_7G032400 [Ceratodon purpureus]|nr:hypothetical protein M758_7G032400 [Ceratodon purpureus]